MNTPRLQLIIEELIDNNLGKSQLKRANLELLIELVEELDYLVYTNQYEHLYLYDRLVEHYKDHNQLSEVFK